MRARLAGVDTLMAYVHIFYEGSERLHAWMRAQAGMSNAEQQRRWGVVLFRAWRPLVEKIKTLLPTMKLGAIFPKDPTQPLGAFTDAPRLAIDEVAVHAEIATNSKKIPFGAYLSLIAPSGLVFEPGPVERAAPAGSPAHTACEAHLQAVLDNVLLELALGLTQMASFDVSKDVRMMTCTPWRETEGDDLVLHIVVTFEHLRYTD
eukprot:3805031-Prymnesium_polylepis.3